MKLNLKPMIFVLTLTCSGAAHAESVADAKIISISSSPSQCNGDAIIKTNPAIPNCTFGYIKSTDSSASQTYSLLLAAFMAGKEVNVNVVTTDNNTCWSSAPVCKIMSAGMSSN